MVDIGAAQLAMHSAVETTGAKDAAYLAGACKTFYCSDLHCVREGVYSLTGENAAEAVIEEIFARFCVGK